MAQDPSSAKALSSVKQEFANVEFLDSALEDPLNVLRLKLQELSELPSSSVIRRITVIADVVTDEGRGLDVTWSEQSASEPYFVIVDSIVAMMERVKIGLLAGDYE